MSWRLVLVTALVASALGCSGDDPTPSAPSSNDPAFTIDDFGGFLIIGNELTAGHDRLSLRITAPADVERVVPWIADEPRAAANRDGDVFTVDVDVSALGAGEHSLLLAADGSAEAFARVMFLRSHPLYVITTIDWDFADTADGELAWHEQLHGMFPALRLTQLVGPYTFTEPTVASDRANYLTAWLQGMRDTHGDEVGLHIHPYCSFVESAGLTCRHLPSVVGTAPDTTGYTVECSAYPQAEFEQLLKHADELFAQNGLGKPTSFRAGAWTANDEVLRALAATGYLADTSANNWQRLEEWTTPTVAPIWDWNKQHWSEIGDTSQPYFPSQSNVQAGGEPAIPILEVPDNGSLVDYVTDGEMIEIFASNWPGGALTQPAALSIGFHNRTQASDRGRMEAALAHLSTFDAAHDLGPVVFITLSEAAQVWRGP
jgi:hypothetical protein